MSQIMASSSRQKHRRKAGHVLVMVVTITLLFVHSPCGALVMRLGGTRRSIASRQSDYSMDRTMFRCRRNGFTVMSSTAATPVKPSPTTTRIDDTRPQSFKDRVASTFMYPYNKARGAKEFLDTQLPMLRYLWPKDDPKLRLFLVLSMIFMFIGKWFNVKVPFILQRAIDSASLATAATGSRDAAALITRGVLKGLPVGIASTAGALTFYGLSRALTVVFSEIKTCLFTHVQQNVLRKFAFNIFSHLHSLDSEFHLETPSGVISVAYVRAVRGFQTMLFQLVFSVAPTLLELTLVSHVLYRRFGPVFAGITLMTFSVYLLFTVWITQWRVGIRKELVDVDNVRNGFFIDSILNHEVVKLFTNEKHETARYDGYLTKIQDLSVSTTYAVALLNLGQAAVFCAGLTSSLLMALHRVSAGRMTVGDLVAVNSMLLQLSIPFNFIGYTYQELRQSFVDMGYMRNVLVSVSPRIANDPAAPDMEVAAPRTGPSMLEFRNVSFRYSKDGYKEELLKGINLTILPGQNVAIVGPSGSGKSTTLKLITRILDPDGGQVLIDGVDTRTVSVESLRRRIAVVPQDTSLFDETVEYNLRYGNASATDVDLQRAIERCNLVETIAKLKDGLQTTVGERGARLSGGERQKVSIARAMLKDPTLILCDEVTSSVDAFAERDIVDTLRKAAELRTTLTVAHRLSSITHCDLIVVIDKGRVVEQGTHLELLKRKPEGVYFKMWEAQNGQAEAAARREARIRRRSECELEFDGDDDEGVGSEVGMSTSDMMAAIALAGCTGEVGMGLGGTGASISSSGSSGNVSGDGSGSGSGSGSAGGGTHTAFFSATSSLTAAVASVRRRRNDLERGRAAATAADLADRVLGGRYDSGRWTAGGPPGADAGAGAGGVGYVGHMETSRGAGGGEGEGGRSSRGDRGDGSR